MQLMPRFRLISPCNMIEDLIKKLLWCVFTRHCDLCGEVVPLKQSRCDDCLENPKIDGERCISCGSKKTDCNCKNSHHKPEYEEIVAPFYYDGNVVKAVHRLKFSGFSELAEGMANEMALCIKSAYNHINFDAITYIPLSRKREKARGYNQSKLIAVCLSKLLDVPLEDTFYKAYENPPQRNQTARQRRANVFGAFDINENINPHNKTYLVVDDVKTTGATLSECAAVLDSYGATAVYAAAFAVRKAKSKNKSEN